MLSLADIDINSINQNIIILFRLVLSVILAFIPGIERELTGKFAGLRTHILVCLGACVFTILSLYGFQQSMHVPGIIVQDDPARVAAQVITGIGFIGAGSVMRHGSSVSGITTAATLWVCASIGMACGCGEYILAIVASIVTLVVLITIRKFEKVLISKRKEVRTVYEIRLSAPMTECENIENVFENCFNKILKFKKKSINNEELKFSAVVATKKKLGEMNEIFKKLNNIHSVEIGEFYE